MTHGVRTVASVLRLVALLVVFGAVFAVPVRCAQTALATELPTAVETTVAHDDGTTIDPFTALQGAESQDATDQDERTSDPLGCGTDGPPRVSDLPVSFESKPSLPGVLFQPDGLPSEPQASAAVPNPAPALTGTAFTPEAPPPRF